MSAKPVGGRPKVVSSRKVKAKVKAAKPVVTGLIIVDDSLMGPEAMAALAKQEKRGYRIVTVDGICTGDAPVVYERPIIFLAPYASWWDKKFWAMLDAKVKAREKDKVK